LEGTPRLVWKHSKGGFTSERGRALAKYIRALPPLSLTHTLSLVAHMVFYVLTLWAIVCVFLSVFFWRSLG